MIFQQKYTNEEANIDFEFDAVEFIKQPYLNINKYNTMVVPLEAYHRYNNDKQDSIHVWHAWTVYFSTSKKK